MSEWLTALGTLAASPRTPHLWAAGFPAPPPSSWAAWFSWPFDASAFVPRARCGVWPAPLVAANVVANTATWLAYWWIAGHFAGFYRRVRGHVGGAWLVLAIASFVAWCGIKHLDDVAVFWWPAYRLFTSVEVVTAVLSVLTAMVTRPVLDYLAALPSYDEMVRDRDMLAATLALAECRGREIEGMHLAEAATNAFLRGKLAILEDRLGSEIDYTDRMVALDEVRAMLASIPEGGGDARPIQ